MTVKERKIKTINIEYAGIKKEGNKRFRHMKRLRTIDHCQIINAFFTFSGILNYSNVQILLLQLKKLKCNPW
jgi:intein/homing endonuclease